jgi:prepilin peptidase CpaA
VTHETIWFLTAFFAVWAGALDWRYRRIPNWLTVSGLVIGLVVNSLLFGWAGAKAALFGAALGLLVLFPFVLLRALGGGDWKLVGALGALLGPGHLIDVLIAAMIVAGIMAAGLVITKGRTRETIRNIGHLLASLATFQKPGPEVSLDNPNSAKIPFGVSVAVAAVLYAGLHVWQIVGKAS